MGESLANLDRDLVHIFHGDRHEAGPDDGRDRVAGLLYTVKAEEHGLGAFGGPEDSHRRLGHDAELSLGSDHEPQKIEPACIQVLAADVDDRAVDQHHADTEHVVGGDPVFQAMGTAGIHGDVSRDRAGELRRRIGSIEELLVRHRCRYGEIGDAGFDPRGSVGEIDVEDLAHLADPDHDGVGLRDGATAERCPSAPRHDLDALPMEKAHDTADLLGGTGENHGERHLPIGRQPVGLEGPTFVVALDQSFGRQDRGEPRQYSGAAGQDGGVGHWKGDSRHCSFPPRACSLADHIGSDDQDCESRTAARRGASRR